MKTLSARAPLALGALVAAGTLAAGCSSGSGGITPPPCLGANTAPFLVQVLYPIPGATDVPVEIRSLVVVLREPQTYNVGLEDAMGTLPGAAIGAAPSPLPSPMATPVAGFKGRLAGVSLPQLKAQTTYSVAFTLPESLPDACPAEMVGGESFTTGHR